MPQDKLCVYWSMQMYNYWGMECYKNCAEILNQNTEIKSIEHVCVEYKIHSSATEVNWQRIAGLFRRESYSCTLYKYNVI